MPQIAAAERALGALWALWRARLSLSMAGHGAIELTYEDFFEPPMPDPEGVDRYKCKRCHEKFARTRMFAHRRTAEAGECKRATAPPLAHERHGRNLNLPSEPVEEEHVELMGLEYEEDGGASDVSESDQHDALFDLDP